MPVDPLLNRQFGPYILLRRLAVGGMAEIYLALKQGPLHVRKIVVLKCISVQNNQSPEYIKMFYHEAELSLRMSHPNIIQTWDVVQIDGRHTMVLEFLFGITLDDIMKKTLASATPLPLDIALWITLCTLDALDYVHTLRAFDGSALDIVHRDVTPQNIFIRFDGHCKLFDFGVATSSKDPQQNEKGMLIGKYAYMSPEQCRGEDIDGRSDIFAMAIILYEMLTGHSLFARENDIKTLEAVNHAEIVSPRTYQPSLSPKLCDILMKALQRNREDRYPDARQFSEAIRNFMKEACIDLTMVPLCQYVHETFRDTLSDFESFMKRAIEEVEKKFPPSPICFAKDSDKPCEELVPINEGSINISISRLSTIPMTPLQSKRISSHSLPTVSSDSLSKVSSHSLPTVSSNSLSKVSSHSLPTVPPQSLKEPCESLSSLHTIEVMSPWKKIAIVSMTLFLLTLSALIIVLV